MDVRQLECLVAIVDEGGFGRAGARLGISQPAVSLQIRRLEEALGEPVLVREGRTVRPTAFGASILPLAREVLRGLRGIEETASQSREALAGTVSLGTIPGWGIDLVPELMARFRANHPQVAISLSEAPANELIERVRSGELDAAITGTASPSTHGLLHAVLAVARMVAVTSHTHPLAGRASIPLGELLEGPVMCNPAGSGIRAALDTARKPAGLPLVVHLESGNPAMLANLAAHGLGVAIVPDDDATLRRRADLHVIEIVDPPVIGHVELVWTAVSDVNPAVRAFLGLVKEKTGQQGTENDAR